MPQVKVLFAFHPKDSAETRQALLAAVSGSREFDKGGENPLLAYTAMGKGTRRLIAGVRTSVLFDTVLTAAMSYPSIRCMKKACVRQRRNLAWLRKFRIPGT